ncbi:MAG TPA: hypothetical protein VGR70_00370 [Stellaceae bacterium]|nr:hypothetical protein [Stellaceae bacterium]
MTRTRAKAIPIALTGGRRGETEETGLVDCVIVSLGGLALALMLIHQNLFPTAMQLLASQ